MKNEIKELRQALEHVEGQLKALTQLVAAFIAASPDRDAFVREALPKLVQLLDQHEQGQYTQTYLDGLHEPAQSLKAWIDLLNGQ